jgi:hypothetical protein
MDDASLRVSDDDRERAVVALRDHLLAGRLTLEEFSDRVEGALQARVSGELARIQADLPAVPAEADQSRRKPTRLTAALFSQTTRRGRLRLRGWTVVGAAFADLDFDLREAAIDRPRTAATVLLAFGNVDVYLPDGINVVVSGITAFGHLRDRGQDIAAPGAPTIHVRVVGCFATVDIWRVPSDAHGSYSDIFRQVEERERQLPA